MKKKVMVVMGLIFIGVLVVTAVVFPLLSSSQQPAAVNATGSENGGNNEADDFTVYDGSGAAVQLSDFKGKPVVVNFWATWCGYCVDELQGFDNVYKDYKDQVTFLMTDLPDGYRETQLSATKFVEKNGYSFPVYFDSDGSATKAYSIRSVPMTLLIDKEGNLYKNHRGLIDEATLREYINSLI